MEAVAEMTNFNFEQIFQMTALEFFAYVAYLRWKAEKEAQKQRELNAKMKRKH